MEQLRLSRRDILKGAAAAGGLAAAGTMLGPLAVLADQESDRESMAFGPWSNVHQIEELASTFGDYHPAISRDGRSLYFTTDRSNPKAAEIWVSQRDDEEGTWGPPASVGALNFPGFNSGVPNLEPNGHVIYFNSNRPFGSGGGDIWVSHRKDVRDDFGWEVPYQLPGLVNTAFSESGPTYFNTPETDVVRLFFTRFKGKGSLAEASQDWDIYVSLQGDDGSFGAGVIVASLNSSEGPPWSRDTRTAIRRDGLEMLVTSNRHTGPGMPLTPTENIWVFTRTDTTNDDGWTVSPNQPGPPLNSGKGDGGPALSWDGTTLYFFSLRSGKRQLWTATRERL